MMGVAGGLCLLVGVVYCRSWNHFQCSLSLCDGVGGPDVEGGAGG